MIYSGTTYACIRFNYLTTRNVNIFVQWCNCNNFIVYTVTGDVTLVGSPTENATIEMAVAEYCGRTKFFFRKNKMFPDTSYYKQYNGSCFIYLSEILSKLQMFKVTNFMTFSDGLCNFVYKPHTFNFFLFSPGHNH